MTTNFLTNLNQLKGKTIESAILSGQRNRIALKLSDGAVAIIKAEIEDYEPEIYLSDEALSFYQQHEFGLMSDEEYNQILAESDARRAKAVEIKEKEQLKTLLAKYGSSQTG